MIKDMNPLLVIFRELIPSCHSVSVRLAHIFVQADANNVLVGDLKCRVERVFEGLDWRGRSVGGIDSTI